MTLDASATELLIAAGILLATAPGAIAIGDEVWHQRGQNTRATVVEEMSRALAAGIVVWWMLVLLLGHLGALNRPVFAVVLLAMAALGASKYRLWARWWFELRLAFARTDALGRLLVGVLISVFILLLFSGTRMPGAQDELDYHWAAPVGWTEAGRWIELPFRFSTGPALAEHLYTVAAVFEAPTAAHWLHTLFFALLILATASLARRFGGRAILAGAAVAAVPILLVQAPLAYNDVAFAALVVAAGHCALLASTTRDFAVVGLVAGGAVVTKPIAGLFLIVVALVVLTARRVPLRAAAVGFCAAAAVTALAFVQSAVLTGNPLPPSDGFEIARVEDDPYAAGRMPTVTEVAIAPLMPVYAAVIGAPEPYGGRTGPVIGLGFVAVIAAAASSRSYRRQVRPLLAGIGLSLVAIVPVFPKTRFHGLTWALIGAAIAVLLSNREVPGWAMSRTAKAVFVVAVLLGIADAARVVVRPWS